MIHISRPSIYPTVRTLACVKVSSRKVQPPCSAVPAITHQLLDFKYNHSTMLSFIVEYIQDGECY